MTDKDDMYPKQLRRSLIKVKKIIVKDLRLL